MRPVRARRDSRRDSDRRRKDRVTIPILEHPKASRLLVQDDLDSLRKKIVRATNGAHPLVAHLLLEPLDQLAKRIAQHNQAYRLVKNPPPRAAHLPNGADPLRDAVVTLVRERGETLLGAATSVADIYLRRSDHTPDADDRDALISRLRIAARRALNKTNKKSSR